MMMLQKQSQLISDSSCVHSPSSLCDREVNLSNGVHENIEELFPPSHLPKNNGQESPVPMPEHSSVMRQSVKEKRKYSLNIPKKKDDLFSNCGASHFQVNDDLLLKCPVAQRIRNISGSSIGKQAAAKSSLNQADERKISMGGISCLIKNQQPHNSDPKKSQVAAPTAPTDPTKPSEVTKQSSELRRQLQLANLCKNFSNLKQSQGASLNDLLHQGSHANVQTTVM
mmetsp:Transcript_6836/g.11533  ORF Transcript_6836/g.11533 Transcript_6836/m.11533 type:complete len:226 (+) Transcript_6836:633-1310(+)